MGGFFSSPAPAPLPPLPQPEPEPAPDPAAEAAEAERQARIDNLERRRRGRAGTITTSDRGLLDDGSGRSGKTLLGE
ncbi:MAG: hypothetical protein ACPGNT_05345 [Rhodospirillales bacterium]